MSVSVGVLCPITVVAMLWTRTFLSGYRCFGYCGRLVGGTEFELRPSQMIALLVVLAVSTVSAMPIQPRKAPLRFVKRGETLLPFFYPGTITRVPPQQAGFAAQTDLQLAYATLLLEIGASDLDLVLDRTYTDAFDITHFSFTRTINGVAVSNQNAAVHTSSGSVVYFSASFTLANGLMRRSAQPDASPIVILCHDEAIKIAEAALSIPAYLNNSAPCLEYLQLYGGT